MKYNAMKYNAMKSELITKVMKLCFVTVMQGSLVALTYYFNLKLSIINDSKRKKLVDQLMPMGKFYPQINFCVVREKKLLTNNTILKK